MFISPTGKYLDIELNKEIKNIQLSKNNILDLVSLVSYRNNNKNCVVKCQTEIETNGYVGYVGQELKQMGRILGEFETYKVGCNDLEQLLIYLAEQRYFHIIIDTIGWYPDTMLSLIASAKYTKKLMNILQVYSDYFEHIIISNPYNNLYASLHKYFKKELIDSVDKK